MMTDLFDKFLFQSDKLRNGYINSLGNASPLWKNSFYKISSTIPEVVQVIYGKVAGTHRNISEQRYMDFIPGYRLIHIEELEGEYHNLLQLLASNDMCELQGKMIVPLLDDYSSCYICYAKTADDREIIVHCSPDNKLQKMHNSIELFFKTIISFYSQDVYYLDTDGYLDYDFEKEGIIGATYNPGIEYWVE